MSEPNGSDLSDSAELLLGELEATEVLLRTLAVEMLDYREVLAVERRAHETARRLLGGVPRVPRGRPDLELRVGLGGDFGGPPALEDATDELLSRGAPSSNRQPGPTGADGGDLGADDSNQETPRGAPDRVPPAQAANAAPSVVAEEPALEDPSLEETNVSAFEGALDEIEVTGGEEAVDLEDNTLAHITRLRPASAPPHLPEVPASAVRTDEPPVKRRAEVDEAVDDMATTVDRQAYSYLDEDDEAGALDEDTDEAPQGSDTRFFERGRAASDVPDDSDEVDRDEVISRGAARPIEDRGEEPSFVDGGAFEDEGAPAGRPSYLDEDPSAARDPYVAFPPTPKAAEEEDPTDTRRPAAGDPWAHLVSFAEPAKEPEAPAPAAPDEEPADDPWAEQRRAARDGAGGFAGRSYGQRPAVLDARRDALAANDHGDDVVGQDLVSPGSSDREDAGVEDVELEIENTQNEPLDIDNTRGDYEEEEVTVLRASQGQTDEVPPGQGADRPAAAAAPSRKSTPIGGAPRGGTPIGAGGGLFGGAVPTIRSSDDPRPRAAAVQLNAGAGGGARMLGSEEEDIPIEIGEAEGLDDVPPGEGGFSLKVQEYEDDYEEEEEEGGEEEPELEEPQGPQYDEVHQISREEVADLLARAQAAATAGELQSGADLYSDLLDQDPDNLEAHVARGRLYLDLGDYSRAMSDFMVSEDLAPTDPEPQVAIGDLYFARKDYRRAIDYFNAALELTPNHAMAYCRRGISHYYRKSYAEAVADLLKAQKLDPDIANIQTYVSMAKKKAK